MVDRQDIDALLIGSLYGELSSADEAQLQAHLESHPADRTVLADLTHAREVVRESRILQVQLDPPQSISALLMQEAARRAPRAASEGWFQRFLRSFMLHPAMAAAAMLVLVVGVAGTMYLRSGDQFASQSKEAPSELRSAEQAPALAGGDGEAAQPVGGAGQGPAPSTAPTSGFGVTLQDELRADEGTATATVNQPVDLVVDQVDGKNERAFRQEDRAQNAEPSADKVAAKRKAGTGTGYVEVTTPQQTPKELVKRPAAKPTSPGRGGELALGGATGAGAPAVVDSDATPPRAPRRDAPAKTTAAPPPPAVSEQQAESPETTWARTQHGRVIAQVRAGNCTTAANLAIAILNRTPGYYAQHVESDRALKNCLPHITTARERDAERMERARATSKRAGDEPATTEAKPAK